MDLTPTKPVGSLISGSTWCIGRCISRAAQQVWCQFLCTLSVALSASTLALWFLGTSHAGVGRVTVAWAYRRCTHLGLPLLHPFLRRLSHRSRDNHEFHLFVVIQSRDERVHGIIMLEDVNPLVCKSQNGLSPGIDGAIPLKRGHATPATWKNHHLRFWSRVLGGSLSSGGRGPSHPSFPGLRGLAKQCSILFTPNSMSSATSSLHTHGKPGLGSSLSINSTIGQRSCTGDVPWEYIFRVFALDSGLPEYPDSASGAGDLAQLVVSRLGVHDLSRAWGA